MVREDLVNGAVSFLRDPSVASAPLEQRIAFLKSKNLTQEEIDVSLQRVGSESVAPEQSQQFYRQPPGYANYPNPYWQSPPPPPPVPRRDWRDWFIMATVVGGVGYGAFTLAKRYVYPVIAPPTPPQLAQDKASIDASFDKAFALLEQLSQDTDELKAAEKARTERLDQALAEVENVIGTVKQASERRDDEVRRTNEQVKSLKDLIPRAIQSNGDATEKRLEELAREMQGLKTLITNRVNNSAVGSTSQSQTGPSQSQVSNVDASTGGSGVQTPNAGRPTEEQSSNQSTAPSRPTTASPYSSARFGNGTAKIPAWQMAAASSAGARLNGSNASSVPGQDTSESGTLAEGATTPA